MKIKSKLLINLTVALLAAAAIVLGILVGQQREQRVETRLVQAHEMALVADDLNLLTYEQLLHGEPWIQQQWRDKAQDLERLLARFSSEDPQQRATMQALLRNLQNMTRMFQRWSAMRRATPAGGLNLQTQEAGADKGAGVRREYVARLTGQLLVLNHAVIHHAERLSRDSLQHLSRARRQTNRVTLFLVALFTFSSLLISYRIARSISRPLGHLEASMQRYGAGERDQRVEPVAGDEIGALGHAFNQMADTLEGARRQMHLILASAAEGICGLDLEGRIRFINPAGAEILGHEPAALIGQSLHHICRHADSEGHPLDEEACPICADLKAGHTRKGEAVHCHHHGGQRFPVAYGPRKI